MKVMSLGHNSSQLERDIMWRDRFGWRVWWDTRLSWWVTQADSGAGSDKPRPITDSDLTMRGPFVEAVEGTRRCSECGRFGYIDQDSGWCQECLWSERT